MFEYHEPNLTIDADGVSVTVKLAEPLDIEKPLAGLDLTTGEISAVEQWVVGSDELPIFAPEPTDEDDNDFDYHFVNGYTTSNYSPEYELYRGEGNDEVVARALSYQELGVRGLLTFCSQESQALKEWLDEAHVRSGELEKIATERAEAEAAELERIMPGRELVAGFQELNKFMVERGVEVSTETPWKEVDGKQLILHGSTHAVAFIEEGFVCRNAIILRQQIIKEKYNPNSGEVTVSERGYFTVKKCTAYGQTPYDQEYRSVEEALESLIPYVLEGEEDWYFGPTAPGLPLPPRK